MDNQLHCLPRKKLNSAYSLSARSLLPHLGLDLIFVYAMSDEDDYMSMVIEEPTQKETFTQKKRREQREVGPFPNPTQRFHLELVISQELVLTFQLQYRPKPAAESLLKPNAPHKKPPAEMKL
jgi:hypothetical protein